MFEFFGIENEKRIRQAAKNIKVFAKGYNLLNEAYCEQAGYISDLGSYNCPAQSRRFLIGAEYSF